MKQVFISLMIIASIILFTIFVSGNITKNATSILDVASRINHGNVINNETMKDILLIKNKYKVLSSTALLFQKQNELANGNLLISKAYESMKIYNNVGFSDSLNSFILFIKDLIDKQKITYPL